MGRLVSVACIVGGVWFGLNGWYADWLSTHGATVGDYNEVQHAAEIFPYARFIRSRPAYVIANLVQPGSVMIIEDVLRKDPFAADLTWMLAIHARVSGDREKSDNAMRVLRQIAPLTTKELPP